MSALIPWIGFLTLNLISEYNSPDKELIKGTWIFFQLTIGTIIAITGFIGGLVVLKLSNKNNVPKKLN